MYDRIREHVGLLLAALGVVLVACRLLAAAAYESDTALAILQASGTGDVVVGTALTLLPSAMALALAASIAAVVFLDKRAARRMAFAAGAVPAFVLAVTPTEADSAPFVVCWLMSLVARSIWEEARIPKERSLLIRRRTTVGVGVIAAMTVVGGALDTTMWLPVETVRTGTEVHVGYVLSAGSDKTVVLVDDDRRVLHAGPATKRVLCRRTNRSPRRSIVSRLHIVDDAPRYPVCAESLV